LKRHKKTGDKKWDAETEKNTNITTYEADIPAGYGAPAAAADDANATNATAPAALSVRPSQKTLVGLRQKKSHKRIPKSNQEMMYMFMQGSTLGAFKEEDTADFWKEKMDKHSNSDDYGDDTPTGYGYTADLQTSSNNMVRANAKTLPANWGDKSFG
jgi:hypothetical protein